MHYKIHPQQLYNQQEEKTMMQKKSLAKMTCLLLAGGLISLAAIQTVTACQTHGPGMKGLGMMKGQAMMQGTNPMAEMMKSRDAFLKDSQELRKSMMMKRAAMKAMMRSAYPDADKIAKLAGEIFDIREQLRAKAEANGMPGMGMMMGGGMMGGGMMGGMKGPNGMHHGCKMMQGGGPMMGGMPQK